LPGDRKPRNLGILFVEDEKSIVEVLSEVLKGIFSRSTVMIYPITDGHKALKILEQNHHMSAGE